jgi:hypothetical protein
MSFDLIFLQPFAESKAKPAAVNDVPVVDAIDVRKPEADASTETEQIPSKPD